MAYRAPVSEMLFSMRAVAGLDAKIATGLYPDLTPDLVAQILEAAGDFAAERLAPLNRPGDLAGLTKDAAAVRTPDGFARAYRDWIAGGWITKAVAPSMWRLSKTKKCRLPPSCGT